MNFRRYWNGLVSIGLKKVAFQMLSIAWRHSEKKQMVNDIAIWVVNIKLFLFSQFKPWSIFLNQNINNDTEFIKKLLCTLIFLHFWFTYYKSHNNTYLSLLLPNKSSQRTYLFLILFLDYIALYMTEKSESFKLNRSNNIFFLISTILSAFILNTLFYSLYIVFFSNFS
jgi:hypothetical protein